MIIRRWSEEELRPSVSRWVSYTKKALVPRVESILNSPILEMLWKEGDNGFVFNRWRDQDGLSNRVDWEWIGKGAAASSVCNVHLEVELAERVTGCENEWKKSKQMK